MSQTRLQALEPGPCTGHKNTKWSLYAGAAVTKNTYPHMHIRSGGKMLCENDEAAKMMKSDGVGGNTVLQPVASK